MLNDSRSSSPLSNAPSDLSEVGNLWAKDGLKEKKVLPAKPARNLKRKQNHVRNPPARNQSSPTIEPGTALNIADEDSQILSPPSKPIEDSEQSSMVDKDSDFESLGANAPPLEDKGYSTPGPSSSSEVFHDDVGSDGLDIVGKYPPIAGANDSESSRKRHKSSATTVTEDPSMEMNKKRKTPPGNAQKDPLGISPSIDGLRTNSRPTRNRKAPSRFIDMKPQTPTPKKSAKASGASARSRANWDPEYLVTNPKSKLTSANLLPILTGDAAWDVLSESEQAVLYSMLPATPTNAALAALNPVPRPDDLSKRNTAFVTDIRKFQEDLEAGFYDPHWQEAAAEAMELRAAGTFDKWKEKETEVFWGQKMEKK